MKGLPKLLFKTFVTSLVLCIAVNCIYYSLQQKGDSSDYSHAIPLIISGSLFLNFILTVMTVPTLFLAYPQLWNNLLTRFILFFAGPLVFLVTVIVTHLNSADKYFYINSAVIFALTHLFYYYLLIRKIRRA